MATVMVEKIWDEPVTPEKLAFLGKNMVSCLQMRNAQWIRSMIVDDGNRTLCMFDAPDAESVRQSYREMGATFNNVWTTQVLDPSMMEALER